MVGPLEGVRVLDFSEIIAAPYAGMLLADMGADVIKVEPPWGEPWRLIQQFIPLESRTYMAVNRGKRSLPLDLSHPEGREVVHRLLSGAPDMPGTDVVIHNYRPGVASRLGIDYETLSGKSPSLIYCEATAFGTQGPHSQRPGYDIIVQAMSGLMASEAKSSEGVPQHVFTPVVDTATGISMAWAICAALYAREKTGRGQKIEASLLATALGMHGSRFLSVEAVDAETQGALKEEIDALRQGGHPYNELEDLYLSYHGSPPRKHLLPDISDPGRGPGGGLPQRPPETQAPGCAGTSRREVCSGLHSGQLRDPGFRRGAYGPSGSPVP